MRVLHVVPGVAPKYGGPSRVVFEMCHALQEQGLEVLIATTDADGQGRLPVGLGEPLIYEGVPAIFFSRQWSEAFKYSHPLASWLNRNVKEFDVVHIHAIFSHSSLAASRACRRHGIPYVVRPLGSLVPWGLNHKRLRKQFFWYLGVKQMLGGAAAIHYTTREEKRLAEDSLALARGVVIPLGTNGGILRSSVAPGIFRQHYSSLKTNPYVLILSRLHPVKGLELFLSVFLEATAEEEFRNWRLVLAGAGEVGYVASLKRLVRELGGQDRVLFTGWLDGTEKFSALQEAALMALPSYQENFGLSVVEALACEVPVFVSSYVGLAEEVQTAGAGWVVPLERVALLKTLTEVLREDSERVRRGKVGRELVCRRFLWSAVAGQLVELYSSIRKENPI